MDPRPSTSLRIEQRATVTSQLAHSIRLLELSRQELRDEIQAMLDTNQTLELDNVFLDEMESPPIEHGEDADEADDDDALTDRQIDLEDMASAISEDPSHGYQDLDSLIDVEWDDFHASSDHTNTAIPDHSPKYDFQYSDPVTLTAHLQWQLSVADLNERDLTIAHLIVDALDASGFLLDGYSDLIAEAEKYGASTADIQRVLSYVQRLDPSGVATRSAKEFLLVQLEECDWDTTSLKSLAVQMVQDHLHAMARGAINPIAKALQAHPKEVLKAQNLIRQLRYTPASGFDSDLTEYIAPDLVVRKNGLKWLVILADDQTQSIRINPDQECLIRRLPSTSPDGRYIRDRLREARAFLDGIEFRNQTILKIATAIIFHQRDFLESGEAAMQPLTLTDIAKAVSMHESTVSRIARNKYIRTPQGTFPLRYFFSTRMPKGDGNEVSSTAIRALIKKYTDEENPSSPLSDSAIATRLRKQNVVIARRTVAKYRESISIPSARLRKRIA